MVVWVPQALVIFSRKDGCCRDGAIESEVTLTRPDGWSITVEDGSALENVPFIQSPNRFRRSRGRSTGSVSLATGAVESARSSGVSISGDGPSWPNGMSRPLPGALSALADALEGAAPEGRRRSSAMFVGGVRGRASSHGG